MADFVCEGSARIPVPPGSSQDVFYNPIQEFNRDMSIAAISMYAARHPPSRAHAAKKPRCDPEPKLEMHILEGLSATGLRAIRYAKEINAPGIGRIVANDFDAAAAAAIRRNAQENAVLGKVVPNHGDANLVMFESMQPTGFGAENLRFHVVDLDPYGSAAPFIDAAVRSIVSGGLLCITCTDLAVLAGSQWEACWAKYGAMPIPNSQFCHEMALRMLLQCVQTCAGRYGRKIEPLLSCSIDFYVRVFVRVVESAAESKKMVANCGMVYSCVGCRSYTVSRMGSYVVEGNKPPKFKNPSLAALGTNSNCEICESKLHIGGPLYTGRIHDVDFVSQMIEHVKTTCPVADESSHTNTGTAVNLPTPKYKTHARMLGMLTVISEEIADCPLYYSLDSLCQALHCLVPPAKIFLSALVNAGYKCSGTHCSKTGFKTDAPNSVVWDILKAWISQNPVASKRLVEGAVVTRVLARRDSGLKVNFTANKDAEALSKKAGLVRYQENPKNWGPKSRARPRDKSEMVAGIEGNEVTDEK
ncbi:tRNA methyltransferase 1 [Entophlyctis luteolus]|nr:tRNA methyltransferase 1 [Entophlyctis luteolus]